MTKENIREAMDFLFKRLEKLINAQHMAQIESTEPATPSSDVFDRYRKMIALESDMKKIYNKELVTSEELEDVENRLKALEANVSPAMMAHV